ncbi:MAG TPA: hypothetical protein VMT24_01255 [Aggregatilineaceae bacterium]|nr:hypothetical protein [Aggregatilineaceae bacterium]
MRRLRPHRRHERQREQDQREQELTSFESPPMDQAEENSEYGPGAFEPFVPVSGGESAYAEDEAESAYVIPEAPRRRLRLPRPRLPHITLIRPVPGVEIRVVVLIVAAGLVLTGVFGTLLNLGRIRADVEEWWPLAVIVVAVLWMLIALIRRQVASFLGGAAFGGVGLSLLMGTQGIAKSDETLLGMVLVAVGLGIVIRGFLLRQQSPL